MEKLLDKALIKKIKKKQLFYLLNLAFSMMVFLSAYSFMDAVSRFIMEGFNEVSSKLIVISNKSEMNISTISKQNSLNWETFEKLNNYLGEEYYVSPVIRDYQYISKLNGDDRFVSVWKINYDFFPAVGMNIIEGRSITEFEYSNYTQNCLISEKLKPEFISNYPLGAINTFVYNKLCTFIGVTSSNEIIPTSRVSENIYIPINISTNMNPRSKTKITEIYIRNKKTNENFKDIDRVNEAISIINEKDYFEIWHAEEFWQLQQEISNNLQLLVLAIAVVIIGLAGLSLASNLSLDVTERTGEIGLRIALGATKVNIFTMFFLDGLIVVILGGVLGILFGIALVTYIISPLVALSGQLGSATVIINFTAISISFFVLIITALLASYFPAKKALNIDPSKAIRDI